MITSLYTKYFQKSRSFLYPVLGIKRTSHHSPSGTYIAVCGIINPEDMKLVCTFKDDNSEGFKSFEQQMLLSNPLFSKIVHIEDYKMYVFDFSGYQSDWFNFIMGKYSKFTNPLKKAIKVYYGENSSEYVYMDSFLNPDKYYEAYAKLLQIDPQVLKEVGELCDSCNLDKETLKIPVEHLENLKKVL
jgi:hypothetical protein